MKIIVDEIPNDCGNCPFSKKQYSSVPSWRTSLDDDDNDFKNVEMVCSLNSAHCPLVSIDDYITTKLK